MWENQVNRFCFVLSLWLPCGRTKAAQTAVWTRLITYLCPSLPVEHRPSTTPHHLTMLWAALVILDQLVPCCFSSASMSHLQLLRGRPLFLFPCGFQVRAWHVVLDAGFLRVCPIQPHFLRSICLATCSCPAPSHISSFQELDWLLRSIYYSHGIESSPPPRRRLMPRCLQTNFFQSLYGIVTVKLNSVVPF